VRIGGEIAGSCHPPRLSGASMPYVPGWLVRSVACPGGRADEGTAGRRASAPCKANYAEGTTRELRPAVLNVCSTTQRIRLLPKHNWRLAGSTPVSATMFS
jgi:hypothetical protein